MKKVLDRNGAQLKGLRKTNQTNPVIFVDKSESDQYIVYQAEKRKNERIDGLDQRMTSMEQKLNMIIATLENISSSRRNNDK